MNRAACRALGAVVVVLAASLLGGRVARAEAFAVLAAPGSEDLGAETRDRAGAALLAAVRAAGHRATPPAEVGRRLEASGAAPCATLECAPAVFAALEVAGVVELTLWSDGRGAAREVVVAIARRDGAAESSGTSPVAAGGLAAAVRAALDAALAGGTRRVGVRLRVTVDPDGAALTLDGRPLGRAPWEGVLPAGSHVIVAGHVGREAARRVVALVAEPVTIALRLAPESPAPITSAAASASAAARADAPRAPQRAGADAAIAPGGGAVRGMDASPRVAGSGSRPVFGPLALGIAGVALLSVDVGALVVLGGDPGPGVVRSLDPAPFVLYGALGLGAVIGAVLWYLLAEEPAAPRLAHAPAGPSLFF